MSPRKRISDEIKKSITVLWNAGLSAKKIGLKLDMSINSVAGIIHRLKKAGVDMRTEAQYSNTKSKPRTPGAKRKTLIKSEIKDPEFRQPKKATKSKERWIPLLALGDKTCRYTKDGKYYCNAPCKDGYCEEHMVIVYSQAGYRLIKRL